MLFLLGSRSEIAETLRLSDISSLNLNSEIGLIMRLAISEILESGDLMTEVFLE